MAEANLTQDEADALISMPKLRTNDDQWKFPDMGGSLRIPLTSADRREEFYLDITRGRIDLVKATYQNRARQVVILVRLDLGGPPHRNPDGAEVPCPHLHVYREGYGDEWASAIATDAFSDVADQWQTLQDFMGYCNITEPPLIERGLFT